MLLKLDVEKSIRFLQDERSQWLRLLNAIRAAGASGDPRVVPRLEAFRDHPEALIRQAAQSALSAIADRQEEPDVFQPENSSTDSHVLTVLVAGAHGAGKTTFIQTISDKDESIVSGEEDSLDTGESSQRDYGRLSIDPGLAWYFLPTLGQKRLDSAWKLRVDRSVGCVILIDSANPETFHDARLILDDFQFRAGLPLVIAANKQDLEEALPAERQRRLLQVSSRVRIVPCIATSYDVAKRVLLELLNVMLDVAT